MGELHNKIRLAIYGYYKNEQGEYIIKCKEHGITKGYMHGYNNNIGCIKCTIEKKMVR